jgi:predicted nucleic acid-binding Zn ribbon protein
MPLYTYRREDGTTFDMRQKFLDEPLTVDPETGQQVVRVVQAPGIIFKGSGFYVNDSKDASRSAVTGNGKHDSAAKGEPGSESKADSKPESKTETKAESKKEPKKEISAAAD